jgi:DNA (cytosine-5)-methyltransferase 1
MQMNKRIQKDKMHRNDQKALTAIDLFCGCGGLTQGLKKAGFTVLGAVDIDPLAIETYRANHPAVTVWETDIQMLTITDLKKKLVIKKESLDLLAGCPPCQGFSTMRTLNGAKRISDPRNDLLMEFQRFVEELKPKTVMLENVPGLVKDRRFAAFCKRMEQLGYRGQYCILNVAKYGVPQRRRRLIYLAGLNGEIAFASETPKMRTVRDAIAFLPPAGNSGDPLHDLPENRSDKVRNLIKKIPKNGGSRTDLSKKAQLKCHRKCDGFKDVYGRMSWDDVAPTITGGCFNPSKGRFLHPTKNRAITMREAALLQSFPRKYKFPNLHSKVDIALLIGNALPPEFIRRHALQIAQALKSFQKGNKHASS